jgi:glycosyltransferase involved in cell wall biosynthesis
MRILHVNKFLYRRGGAEAYMVEVAERQRSAGHEVTMFGMEHPDNPPLPLADTFPSLVEFDQPSHGPMEAGRALGRMLWSTSARRGMARAVSVVRPDVVHLHNIYHALSPSILGPAAAHGAGVVMTLHDYKLACPTYHFLDHGQICTACVDGGFRQAVRRRCKDGSLLRSAAGALELGLHTQLGAYDPVHRFVSPSRFLSERMREAGVYPDRLRVLDNFVDVDTVEPRTEPGGPVVYAGRLSHEKGVDVLVASMAHVPEARLVVAGEGDRRDELEAQADRVAPGRVRFVGRLPRDEVLDLVRSAGVAVLPSRWHENQPMAIIEAFAVGTPVAASDLGGVPELVEHGETGWLVPPDDPMALADALRAALGDPEDAHRMGKVARARAESRFAPSRHLSALEQIYDEAREAAA